MLRQTVIQPFNGAEEITAKRNRDGTYSVEMKTIVHSTDKPDPVIAIVNMPKANVHIDALIDSDDKRTIYTITIPEDDGPTELPQYQTTVEDWKMLGFREAEAKELADESCS